MLASLAHHLPFAFCFALVKIALLSLYRSLNAHQIISQLTIKYHVSTAELTDTPFYSPATRRVIIEMPPDMLYNYGNIIGVF